MGLRAIHTLIRGPESIASLFSRPVRSLQRWDAAARARPTFGLAGLDAHANIPWREQEEPRRTIGLAYPTYETMFRTLVQTVVVPDGLSGQASDDAAKILHAIRTGRSYSTVRALAWPSALLFGAERAGQHYEMGDRLAPSSDGVTFRASLPTASGARLTLMQNGQPLIAGQGSLEATNVTAPGVYRIEAQIPGSSVPWIVSNPITIASADTAGTGRGGRGGGRNGGAGTSAGAVQPRSIDVASPQWNIEHDRSSQGQMRVEDGRLRFDYTLGDGPARGQYVALAHAMDNDDGVETVGFVASASAPLRVSIQVRLPEGRSRTGQRWRQSIYVDQTPTRFVLRLQDFEPADRPTVRRPIVTPLHSFLVVADTVNSRPGASATIWLSAVEVGVNQLE